MELIRIEFIAKNEEAELLSAYLATNLSYGWEEQSYEESTSCIVHTENELFAQELIHTISAKMPQLEVKRNMVAQTNWVEAWKEFFTPVHCGNNFTVLAPWMQAEKEEAQAQKRTPIIIEPKTAFGTGHHSTTALCLKGFSKLIDQKIIKAGQRFLDLGTGSGILAIAAATQGLTGLALDIDMLAIENALENAELNAVNSKIEIRRGSVGPSFVPSSAEVGEGDYDGNTPVDEKFDLIFANILAEPLKILAPHIAACLKPNGILLLSGILITQAQAVAEVYQAQGLPLPIFEHETDWALLTINKAEASK